MITEEIGHGERVRILDFGLARLRGNVGRDATQTNMVVGTPNYMAPEQTVPGSNDRRAHRHLCRRRRAVRDDRRRSPVPRRGHAAAARHASRGADPAARGSRPRGHRAAVRPAGSDRQGDGEVARRIASRPRSSSREAIDEVAAGKLDSRRSTSRSRTARARRATTRDARRRCSTSATESDDDRSCRGRSRFWRTMLDRDDPRRRCGRDGGLPDPSQPRPTRRRSKVVEARARCAARSARSARCRDARRASAMSRRPPAAGGSPRSDAPADVAIDAAVDARRVIGDSGSRRSDRRRRRRRRHRGSARRRSRSIRTRPRIPIPSRDRQTPPRTKRQTRRRPRRPPRRERPAAAARARDDGPGRGPADQRRASTSSRSRACARSRRSSRTARYIPFLLGNLYFDKLWWSVAMDHYQDGDQEERRLPQQPRCSTERHHDARVGEDAASARRTSCAA